MNFGAPQIMLQGILMMVVCSICAWAIYEMWTEAKLNNIKSLDILHPHVKATGQLFRTTYAHMFIGW